MIKHYIYWRQGKMILVAEAEWHGDSWVKKSWTTEVIKEFKTETEAQKALKILNQKLK